MTGHPTERRSYHEDPLLTDLQRERLEQEVQRLIAVKGPQTLEEIPIGFEYTWEETLSQEVVRSYAEPIEDYNPWYESGEFSPYDSGIVPPLLLSHEARKGIVSLGPMPGRVHTLHDSEIISPIPIGTRVRLRTRVTDKGLKRGRPWWEEAIEVSDAKTGQLYFRERRECLLTTHTAEKE